MSLTLDLTNLKELHSIDVPGIICTNEKQADKACDARSCSSGAMDGIHGGHDDNHQNQRRGPSILKALGGLREIRDHFINPNNTPLVLRMNPSDKYTRFTNANTQVCMKICVLVKRYKSGKIDCKVLGLIRSECKFNNLLDYICIPPRHMRTEQDIETQLDNSIHEDLFMAPPIYTRIQTPYNFRADILTSVDQKQNKDRLDREDTGEAMSLEKCNKRGLAFRSALGCNMSAVGRFADDPPTGPPSKSVDIAPDPHFSDVVAGLFNSRPLWIRASLESLLPEHLSNWRKRNIFAKQCFWILHGPWRGCLCRYGYDPKLHKEARIYQTIDFRDPFFRTVEYRTQHKKALGARSMSQLELKDIVYDKKPLVDDEVDIHFRRPPARPLQLYQFCEIKDSSIQTFLHNAETLEVCSPISGWYPKNIIYKIREMLTIKSKFLRQNKSDR